MISVRLFSKKHIALKDTQISSIMPKNNTGIPNLEQFSRTLLGLHHRLTEALICFSHFLQLISLPFQFFDKCLLTLLKPLKLLLGIKLLLTRM